MRHMKILKTHIKRALAILFGIFYLTSILLGSTYAMSKADISDIKNQNAFYKANGDALCGSATIPTTATGNKVFYIGDSLTYHMTQGNKAHTIYGMLLEKTLAAGFSVDTTYTPSGLDGNAPRVTGHSLEAQGGINVINTIPHLAEHPQDIADANIIVIGLGTNKEQTDFKSAIKNLVEYIRTTNTTNPQIYWVNTYFSVQKNNYINVNNDINAALAGDDHLHVIDYAAAAAADPSIAPAPYVAGGADGVHIDTAEGRQKKADWIISQIPKPTGTTTADPAAPASPAGGTNTGSDAYALTYPNFPDEAGLALKLNEFIRQRKASSPYLSIPNFSARLIAEGKSVNTNPLIPLFIAVQESQLGTSPVAIQPRGPDRIINYNSFGNKGNPDLNKDGYKEWPSFEDSFFGPTSFTDGIPTRLASHPSYAQVKTLSDYLSVHVSGKIIKPGDPTQVYDTLMKQYVNYADVLDYIHNVSTWILQVTGQAAPGASIPAGGGCVSGASGVPLSAGAGGYDLPDEGPNPMVYYSQEAGCPSGKSCNTKLTYFGTNTYGTGSFDKCGCGPTALAMIIATLTGNKKTPIDVGKWLVDNKASDISGCGTNSSFLNSSNESFSSTFGVNYSAITVPQIEETLKSGKMVLMSVNISAYPAPNTVGTGGHYVVIRKVVDGSYFMADPFAYGWAAVRDGSNTAYTVDQLSSMVRTGIWAFTKI